MKWCAAFVINLVNVQLHMLSEKVETERLVTLRCDMQAISAINIRHVRVRPHFVDHKLYKLVVAMVRRKVEGGKLFVCVRVYPALHTNVVEAATGYILVPMFQGVAVDGLEALSVVFKRGKR